MYYYSALKLNFRLLAEFNNNNIQFSGGHGPGIDIDNSKLFTNKGCNLSCWFFSK